MLDLDRHREILRQCSIAAALDSVGERWSFLILRGAFYGLKHFEEFQSTLGIARNILSNRLSRMVENGILARAPDPSDRRKVTYQLTDKGEGLFPVILALRQWGQRWERSGQDNGQVLVDTRDRLPIAYMVAQAGDGRTLERHEIEWAEPSEVGQQRDEAV